MSPTLRTWHRRSAAIIGIFAVAHVGNHLVSLAGIESHIRWMDLARTVYRQPIVEVILLASVAFQVCSGTWLVLRGWPERRGVMSWLQALSGAYLAFFLLVHVSAIVVGRMALHLDTNFYYAAAGFHVPPFGLFFAPYYFLAVLSLFTHLACAAYWQFAERSTRARTLAVAVPIVAGATAALLIVLSLGGHIHAVDIPQQYKATYSPSSS